MKLKRSGNRTVLCFWVISLMMIAIFADVLPFIEIKLVKAQQTNRRIDVIVITSSYTNPYEGNGSIYILNYLRKLLPLNYTLEDVSQITAEFLDDYDIVWLANVARLTDSQVNDIINYVNGGGRAMIFAQTGKLNDGDQIRLDNPFETMCGFDLQAWESGARYAEERSQSSWFSFPYAERMNVFKEIADYGVDSLDPVTCNTVNATLTTGTSIAYYQQDSNRKAIVKNRYGSGKTFFFSTNYPKLIWYELTSTAYAYRLINPASIGSMIMLTYYATLDLFDYTNNPFVFVPVSPWGYDYMVLPPNFHAPEIKGTGEPSGMDGDDTMWWRLTAPGRWNESLMTHSDFGNQTPRDYAFTFFWNIMISQWPGSYKVSDSKSYSYSSQPSGSYPDIGGEMTNGAIGGNSYYDTKYSGWQNTASPLTITLDFGSTIAFVNASYRIHALSQTSEGIYYPENLTIFTSVDNLTYLQRNTVDFTGVTESSSPLGKWLPWLNETSTSFSARYIRFSLGIAQELTFLSEIEVYNQTVTAILSSNATNIKNFINTWGIWGTHSFWSGTSTTLADMNKLVTAMSELDGGTLLYTGHNYIPPVYSDTWTELINARKNGTFYNLFLCGRNIGNRPCTLPIPVVLTNFTEVYWASPFLYDGVGGWVFGPEGTKYTFVEAAGQYGLGGFAFDYVNDGNEIYSSMRTAMRRYSEYMLQPAKNFIHLTYPEASDYIVKRWNVNITDFSTESDSWTVKLNVGQEISGLTIRFKGTSSIPVEIAIDGVNVPFIKRYRDRIVLPKLSSGEHSVSITLSSSGYPSTPHLVQWNNSTVIGFTNTTLWIYSNSSYLANTKVLDIDYSLNQQQLAALIEVPLKNGQCCTRGLKFYAADLGQPNSVAVDGSPIPFEYTSSDKIVSFNATFSSAKYIVISWSASGVEKTVTLNSPDDGATSPSYTQTFIYTPSFSSTIQNSSLWLNLNGTWQRVSWNNSAVQNAAQNAISYSFSELGTYLWNIQVFDATDGVFATSNRTLTVERGPSLVGQSASQWLTNDPFQRKGFYHPSSGFMFYFYRNGTDYIYKTSSNGVDWGGESIVFSSQGGTSSQEGDQCIAVHWDGTYVNIVYANNGVDKPIQYRRGTISGSPPTITWEDLRTVYEAVTRQFAIPNIIKDSNGYPWVLAIASGGGWAGRVRVWKGNADGTLWSPTAGETLAGSYGGCCQFAQLTNGKLYCVEGLPVRNVVLQGWLYNGTGWSATPEQITNDLYRQEAHSVVSVGDDVEVLYLSNASNVYKIRHRIRTYGTGWGSVTLVQDNQNIQSMPVVAKSGASNLHVFWFYNNILYYKSRNGGIWSTNATTPFGESFDNPNPNGYFINCFPVGVGREVVGVTWREGISSPYSARFAYINISLSFYELSSRWTTISGNPEGRHGFDVVHNSKMIEVNKTVDGQVRKYLAYDSNKEGSEIRLYFTNNSAGTWTGYSGNPILNSAPSYYYRTPTVTFLDGVFHMFTCNKTAKTINRYASLDGISFTFAETILTSTEDEQTLNPFIYFNPNDSKWYLYWRNRLGTAYKIYARNATNILDLDSASDVLVLSSTSRRAYPTIFYRDNYFWLLLEVTDGSIWYIHSFFSLLPTSGFAETDDSPILTNDEACPKIFCSSDGSKVYLFSNRDSTRWYQDTREVYMSMSRAPTYGNMTYNATARTYTCQFSSYWQDNSGLSGFIFGWNGTGSWMNDTWTSLSGTAAWANVTKTLPSDAGIVVGFRWYCNDTEDLWSETEIHTLVTSEIWYYFRFDFFDLDSSNVDARVTWVLWNGSQQLSYVEGYVTLLNGSYTLRVYYSDHQIYCQGLATWNHGNQTVGMWLQMKALGTTNRYVAFNQTVSTITINSATDTNTTFTVTSANTNFLIIVDVPRNCSFVQKDGVNQTGWTYTTSPAIHVYLSTETLGTWQFYHSIPTEPPSGYWENTYGESFIGTWNQKIDASVEKISYRFTAQDSKTVTQIRIRIQSVSASPIYRVGLQGDNGGNPDGAYLTYADVRPSASGWLIVNAPDYTISSGTIYYIVIEHASGTIDSTHYAEFRTSLRITPYNLYPYNLVSDSNLNYLWNGGTGWTAQNHAPIFLLDYSDNTYFGQPYHDISNVQEIYGNRLIGEVFSPNSDKSVNQVAVYVRKINVPTANLTIVLYCITDSQQIFSVDITPEEATANFAWITKNISQITLYSTKTYRLYLKSTGSDSTNRYRCLRLTTDGSPYQARSFYGTACKYSSSTNGGSSWTDQDAHDANFRFAFATSEEDTIFTSSKTDNVTAASLKELYTRREFSMVITVLYVEEKKYVS